MPLQGVYTYSEKEKSRELTLIVPLKGVSVQNVSIAVTASTVKINYSPYLIDIVLFGEIDSLKHKAVVKGTDLHIILYKKEAGLWGALEVDVNNKNELKILKNEAAIQQEEIEKKLNENRYDKKLAEEKYSLRKQMALDDAERNKLDNLKQEEKEQAEKEIYETFANLQRDKSKDTSNSVTKTVKFEDQVNESNKNIFGVDVDALLDNEDVDDDDEAVKNNDESGIEWDGWEDVAAASQSNTPSKVGTSVNDENIEEEVKFIPPPRNVVASDSDIFQATTVHNKVDINFTPRFFPTPMRESKQQEEDDWVAKNRRHLKKHGHFKGHKGKDISEEDPTWLKAKGDDFFRSGDVRSALNAYSSALDIDETMVSCYSNRSACYLKLNMFDECRLDCSDGIKHLTTEQADSDKNMLIKLLMRRGAAACQLGNFTDSLTDYQDALRHSQSNSGSDAIAAGLAEDIQRLELLVTADKLKKEADFAFSENKLTDAIDKYSDAIALIPVHVGCISNRATCKIALKDYQGCIDDCTVALDLLSSSDVSSSGVVSTPSLNMLNSILPAKGSEKRKAWVLKTILRRGQAYLQVSRYDEAIRDYSTASGLDPTNESLKSDINKLVTAREVAKK